MKIRLKLDRDIKFHLSHYLSLLVILNIGVGAFFYFRFNPTYQAAVVVLTSISYVFWGIIHHFICEDLHIKVVLEYLLLALLANLVVLSLLFRA